MEERSVVTTGSSTGSEDSDGNNETPEAASYWDVMGDTKSVILCFTGFFFQ